MIDVRMGISRAWLRAIQKIAVALIFFLGSHASAREPVPQCVVSGSSVEHQVKGSGGGFEVVVNPKLVTVFHLPSKLAQSFLSNQKDFSINVMTRSVALWPIRDNATGNLNLDTEDGIHISVTLKPGPLEAAQAQVIFTSEREEERYEAALEKRLLPLTGREIARGLLRRFEARELNGIARTDDAVIVRVSRSIVVGDDTYVYFSIDNRSDQSHRLSAVKALQGSHDIPTRVEFEPRPDDSSFLGLTVKGTRGRGIVIVPTRELKPGQPLELGFIEGTRNERLPLTVRLD